jgi:hypothetical protein
MQTRWMFQAALVLAAAIASIGGRAAEPPADAASAPRLPAAFEACARTLSALAKTNFDSRGSFQIDLTLPVRRSDPKGLRWYAQAFTGYGETLIDYNFRQTSFGAGVTLFGW